jgi:hypothetical protein
MMDKFFPLSTNSQITVTGSSYIIAQTFNLLQPLFTPLFGVFFSAEKNLKTIGSKAFGATLFCFFRLFNNSVEWLNQLILSCVSVFVLRGGTANVAL